MHLEGGHGVGFGTRHLPILSGAVRSRFCHVREGSYPSKSVTVLLHVYNMVVSIKGETPT